MRARSWSRLSRTPIAVALASAFLTALAAGSAWSWLRAREEADLQRAANDVVALVERRMAVYVAMLRGAAGLFAASSEVHPDEFRRFVSRQELGELPGIQGVGWSRRLDEREPGHGAQTIELLEPRDERNRAAIGFDMTSEPIRRAAMDMARDRGKRAASGRLFLVQEIDDVVRPGFLIYVPVYRGGAIPGTVHERRAALDGFVYAAFRADDLFGAVLESERERCAVEVFDGETIGEETRLYGAPPGAREDAIVRQVVVAGRPWTVRFSPAAREVPAPLAVGSGMALLGMLLTALVYRATYAEAIARAQAERASHAKDELLAVVSHELRTPLQAMLGWVAIARELGVPPALDRPIRVIERNGRALARLVEDLIDASRAATGELTIERRSVALGEIVRGAAEAATPLARAKGVTLEVDVALDGVVVRGDPARLRQAIDNVVSNAIKFCEPDGHVRVRASATTERARIEISDDGRGIAEADLERIFDRFAQVDSSTTRRGSGLGLGLALADEIIAIHGGTIHASSDGRGRGATLTIELPIEAEACDGRSGAQSGSGNGPLRPRSTP